MGHRLIAIDHVQLAMPAGEEEVAASLLRGYPRLSRAEAEAPGARCSWGMLVLEWRASPCTWGSKRGSGQLEKAHPAVLVENLDELSRGAEGGRSRGTLRRRDPGGPSLLRRRPIRQSHRAHRVLRRHGAPGSLKRPWRVVQWQNA